MKKKILIISLLAFFLCGCGKVSKLSNGSDAVVSFSDNEKISIDSLYEEMKDRYAIGILIDMIDKEILYKVYENDIDEAKENAETSINSLKQNYDSEEELINAIYSYYGFSTLDEFKDYLCLNYLRDKATTDYAKTKITDKQINKYYEEEIVGDIEASHILITPETNDNMTDEEIEEAEEKAKEEAESIIKKLENGEKFEDLAKKYSDDDSNKNDGGALGKFNKGDMVEAFEKAAYELKVNEYTKEPVKTTYGYHIILKTKEYDKASLEDSKDKIIETLADELINNDQTISITALTELRKEKGMNIEDSNLNSEYNKYINSLYNYYQTNSSTN